MENYNLYNYHNKNQSWKYVFNVALGIIIGTILMTLPLMHAIAILAGILLLIASAKKPELSVLVIVILTSSIIFEDKLPLLPIGIGSLHISDILLINLSFIVTYRILIYHDMTFAESPLNKPLGLFLVTVIISAYISVNNYNVDYNHVMRVMRTISYYCLFYLITNLITKKEQIIFLIRGLFFIAVVVAIAMVIQAIIGESVPLMPGRIEAAGTFSKGYDATRILPPGQMLICVFLITAICFVTFMKNKYIILSGHFTSLFLLSIGVILTYNRNYWVAVLMSICIVTILASNADKAKLFKLLIIVTIIIGSWVALFVVSGWISSETVEAVSERFTSLFAGKELTQSSSLESRYIENGYAIRQIISHPVLGIGLGNDYRPDIYGREDNLTDYIHNGYLWVMMNMGLAGFSFFMWFYLCFIMHGLKKRKRIKDDYLKSAITGFIISGIVILPMTLVNPIFMQWYSIVVLSIIIGLTEAIIKVDENGKKSLLYEVRQ